MSDSYDSQVTDLSAGQVQRIQTSARNPAVVFDKNGLRAYDADGSLLFDIDAVTASAFLQGGVVLNEGLVGPGYSARDSIGWKDVAGVVRSWLSGWFAGGSHGVTLESNPDASDNAYIQAVAAAAGGVSSGNVHAGAMDSATGVQKDVLLIDSAGASGLYQVANYLSELRSNPAPGRSNLGLGSLGELLLPIGVVLPWSAPAAPSGGLASWRLCDGAAISRTTFAALFALIGTAFGAGDGSTTFNLPDLRSRFPVGAGQGAGLSNRVLGASGGEETHQLSTAEIPSHSHGVTDGGHVHNPVTGDATKPNTIKNTASFSTSGATSGSGITAVVTSGTVGGSSATSSATTGVVVNAAGGGGAHNNMGPFLALQHIIRTA